MKFTIRTPILAAIMAGIAGVAQALPITPASGMLNVTRWEGNQTSQAQIDVVIGPIMAPSNELYKDNVGGAESGSLAGSYNTTYTPDEIDPSGATIAYTGGGLVPNTRYLLVKDGNQEPAWYLFNLTSLGWNGTDNLDLSGFWTGKGAISHVTLYGGTTSVPDGGATMALLGLALLGIEALRRKLAFA